MIRFTFGGTDTLSRDREEAQQAFQGLGGTIATLKFNGSDPTSVKAAIRQMEEALDSKLAAYRGNDFVAGVAAAMKERYRKAILTRAKEGSTSDTLVLRGSAAVKSRGSTTIRSTESGVSDNGETATYASALNMPAVAALCVGILGISYHWRYWQQASMLSWLLVPYLIGVGAFQIGLVSEALAQGYVRESGGGSSQWFLPIRPTGGVIRRDERAVLFWYELSVRGVAGLVSVLIPVWGPMFRHLLR